MQKLSEYAQAGVDYKLIEPFKQQMIAVGKRTLAFPNQRNVFVESDLMHAHGGVYEYRGGHRHQWCTTEEGLGNESWATQLQYERHPERPTYYDVVAFNNAMMAVNDNIAQGALPVIYTDEVAASHSAFFADERIASDFARGIYEACQEAGMALVAGESPVYKYLVNPLPPVKMGAAFGGTVTGIIAPARRLVTGKDLAPGDRILGASSSGIHCNGFSLVFRRILGDSDAGIRPLPDGFDSKLPSGMTLAEALHIRTLCYVDLVECLLENEIPVSAFLPGTGDGVAKLAFDHRPFTYKINEWPKVPELFLFMREIGVSLFDCLKTFNWGVGFYVFVRPQFVEAVKRAGELRGFAITELGTVEEGKHCTIFGPENDLELPPPGQ